jgi:hypothetical protein
MVAAGTVSSFPITPEMNGTSGEHVKDAVPSLAHTLLGAPYEEPLAPGSKDWVQHVPATAIDAKDNGTADVW